MTNPADIAAAVQHDTELLELLGTLGSANAALDAAEDRALRTASLVYIGTDGTGSRSTGGGMSDRVRKDELEIGELYYQSKTWTRGEEGHWIRTETGSRRATVADALERLDADNAAAVRYAEALAALQGAHAAIVEHEVAYTGWNRYFLVVSSSGHVHRSMSCSTCNPRTAYSPVVALSGQTDAAAVDLVGETLCSVCYPEAPVAGKPGKLTKSAAKKLLAR